MATSRALFIARRSAARIATSAGLSAIMFVLAWAAILLTRQTDHVAAVWLANAVVVAVMLRSPDRRWPELLAAAAIGNLGANLESGGGLATAVILTVANLVECMIVALAMRPVLPPHGQFDRSPVIVRFLGAALAGPLVAALPVGLALSLKGPASFNTVLLHWFAADALGMLALAPLLLSFDFRRQLWTARDLAQTLLGALANGAVALAVLSAAHEPVLFLIVPPLVLAALRLTLTGALLSVVVVGGVAIEATLMRHGQIGRLADPTMRIYVLQAFLANAAFVVLTVRALVGERDRIGQAQRRQDRLFHRIAEASPAGIIHCDADGRPDFANRRWSAMTGLESGQLVDDGWIAAIDPDDRAIVRGAWTRVRATLQPQLLDVKVVGDGQLPASAELSIMPAVERGRVEGFVVRLTDISARRRAEAALHEREALYRLVTENAHDVIVRLGLDGTIRFASLAASRVLGHRPGRLEGALLADLVVDDDVGAVAAMLDPDHLGAGDSLAAFRLRRGGDGRPMWIEASYTMVFDPLTGEPAEIIASLRDSDRRRHSEIAAAEVSDRLVESHRLLSLAERLAEVGHCRLTLADGGLDASPQWQALCGQGDWRATLRRFDRPSRRRCFATLKAAIADRQSQICDIVIDAGSRGLGGHVRHVQLHLAGEFGGDRLAAVLAVMRDVSADRAAADQLVRARDQAEAAALEKSRFLATMSHEIRTPMTGVLGMIDLLRRDPAPEDRERFFGTLRQSANLLMAVLDDVLDYSKIDSGLVRLEADDFDLFGLTSATLDLFGNAASRKGLLITFDADRGDAAIVRGDPVRVQQILSNLLSNAIKFTERGKIAVKLARLPVDRPNIDGRDDRWRIEVSDTGVGITADEVERLFEPFFQADLATTRRFGGTGLGLAISRRLAEAMGGKVGVRSRPGRGSTFWIDLPLPAGIEPVAAIPAQAIDDPPLDRPLDLLVAEDNPVNQMLLNAILRRLGHHVTMVDNGRRAVEAAARRRYDCILMDMQMPELDGLAATRAIRASAGPCAAVPIVALTADASPERRRFYDGAGLTDFLTKPIDRGLLAARLLHHAQAAATATPALQPEASATKSSLIDTDRIAELRQALGAQQLNELLAMLVAECTTRPPRIRALIAAGDLAEARREAHSLKGAATSVGAAALGRAAHLVEMAQDSHAAQARLDALDRRANQTIAALDRINPSDLTQRQIA